LDQTIGYPAACTASVVLLSNHLVLFVSGHIGYDPVFNDLIYGPHSLKNGFATAPMNQPPAAD
jgi:hypothetical protein